MLRVMTEAESKESLELNWAKLLKSPPGTLFDLGMLNYFLLYAIDNSESIQVINISAPESALALIEGNHGIHTLNKSDCSCINIRTK